MTVEIGTRKMSYEMQPLNTRGRAINHGMSYANADTIEDARAYAARVIGGDIEGVSIFGRMMEMGYDAWREVPGSPTTYEVIRSPEPAPLTRADEGKSCYFTTVLDHPETVHERRSNGTCQCGHYSRWEW